MAAGCLLENHTHTHGPDCGHQSVPHQGHVDYIHDGVAHHEHDGHFDECTTCTCGCGEPCATCSCSGCSCSGCGR